MLGRALLLNLLLPTLGAAEQAPPITDLWRVGATTLARPAALETGPAALFWNPAAGQTLAGLSVGVQVVETPDVVGLSGLFAGVTREIRHNVMLGLLLSRIEIRDLVRTTSSPVSQEGEIPVYAQSAGLVASARAKAVSGAVSMRAHDTRFDVHRNGGVTIDAGLTVHPTGRLVIAASTQFVPLTLRRGETAQYYAAVEYAVLTRTLGRTATRVLTRYGANAHGGGGLDHTFGAGLGLTERIQFDAAVVRESAFGQTLWRPALAVRLRFGRYLISAARGGSANDVGATYRVGLDLDIAR